MSVAIFNTAKFQETLIEAKVDPNVAKAQAEVLYEAFAENVDKLATKERMDERFNAVDFRFDALNKEIGDMKEDMNERFGNMEFHFNSLSESVDSHYDSLNSVLSDFRKDMSRNKDLMLIWVTSLMLAGLSFVYFMINNLVNNLPIMMNNIVNNLPK